MDFKQIVTAIALLLSCIYNFYFILLISGFLKVTVAFYFFNFSPFADFDFSDIAKPLLIMITSYIILKCFH